MLVFLISATAFLLAGFGLGGGVMLIPFLMRSGFSQAESRYLALLGYIPAAIAVLILNRKSIDLKRVIRLIPFGLLGTGIGALFLPLIPASLAKISYGIFLILFGAYMIISTVLSKIRASKQKKQ